MDRESLDRMSAEISARVASPTRIDAEREQLALSLDSPTKSPSLPSFK